MHGFFQSPDRWILVFTDFFSILGSPLPLCIKNQPVCAASRVRSAHPLVDHHFASRPNLFALESDHGLSLLTRNSCLTTLPLCARPTNGRTDSQSDILNWRGESIYHIRQPSNCIIQHSEPSQTKPIPSHTVRASRACDHHRGTDHYSPFLSLHNKLSDYRIPGLSLKKSYDLY